MLKCLFTSVLVLLLFAGFAASQSPEEAEVTPETEAQEGPPPQPEEPKILMQITVQDNLMSIELENTDFGSVIQSVAEKAGFRVEGSSEVFSKKLTTRFSNVDIERGVMRLFTLVKETNYMMHYDSKGALSRIEIYGTAATVSAQPPSAARPPARTIPSAARPRTPAAQRALPRRFGSAPATSVSRPVQAPAQPQPVPSEEPEVVEEENVSEMPYVAPQPRQPLFPARRR